MTYSKPFKIQLTSDLIGRAAHSELGRLALSLKVGEAVTCDTKAEARLLGMRLNQCGRRMRTRQLDDKWIVVVVGEMEGRQSPIRVLDDQEGIIEAVESTDIEPEGAETK